MFVVLLLAPDAAQAGPNDLSHCGGYGQRACCLLEAFPSCDSGLEETGIIADSTVCAGFPAGTCGGANPNNLSFCGGDGQRACCAGESPLATPCDSGLYQLPIPAGFCAPPATTPTATAGTCWARTDCGGENERACSLLTNDGQIGCDAHVAGFPNEKLVELAGCTGPACGLSTGWCYNPTPCGGQGERACCGADAEADTLGIIGCNSGLFEIGGVSGDATCGNVFGAVSNSLGTCASYSSLNVAIAEPVTGLKTALAPSDSCEEPRGYADLHAHMFGHLAHGGGVLAGLPYADPGGVNVAMRRDFGTYLPLVVNKLGLGEEDPPDADCDVLLDANCAVPGFVRLHGDHSIFHFPLGDGTKEGPGGGASSMFGAPSFSGWPTWRSTTHQQMYYKWLERAWQGGLRLMVQFAVTNEALCRSSRHLAGTHCSDEMTPVDAQIEAARDFEEFVDAELDGDGWFRIVETPAEARQVIDDGKLAVVLGIEVANLFSCRQIGCLFQDQLHLEDDDCWDSAEGCSGRLRLDPETEIEETNEDYVDRMIELYYEKGVRVIFPIHNFENAFGAPATWQDAIHAGNYISENGAWWEASQCPLGYGFKLGGFVPFIVSLFGFGIPAAPPEYFGTSSCNLNGLTPLGEHMIETMMDAGIVIDVDHMSRHSLDETLAIAAEKGVPVIASHVQFYDLNQSSIRHERMRTKAQLQAIRDGGGMIAAMLKDDKQDTSDSGGKFNQAYAGSPTGRIIRDNCRHSSKTFAQMYQYSVDVMQGPVALGSDWNGVAGHVGPRFGTDACGRNAGERSNQAMTSNKLGYPFTIAGFGEFDEQTTGWKKFDFNVDGLAHVGLLPDLVADLKVVGLNDNDLEPLFASAMGFADVWDRAEGNDPGETLFDQLHCEDQLVTADEMCEGTASVADPDFPTTLTLEQDPDGPYSLGTTSVTLSTTGTDACGSIPSPCTAQVTVVDKTAPGITCPAGVTQECAPVQPPPIRLDDGTILVPDRGTAAAFGSATAGEDNCGTEVLTGCTKASGDLFPFGATTVNCGVQDDATPPNPNSCGFMVHVQDTTAPSISCPVNKTAECTGNRSASVTPGAATGSDICVPLLQSITSYGAGTYPVGNTPLTYTAKDHVNLTSTCTQTITVQDTTIPTIACPASVTAECTGSSSAVVNPAPASASDICGTVTATDPPSASYPMGTTTVAYTARDEANLTAGCTNSVTVQDTTNPTITCPAPIVAECQGTFGAAVLPGSATGADVCDTVTLTSYSTANYPLGTTTIPYTSTDKVGLTASCTSTIKVQDTTPPAISSATPTPNVLRPPNHKMHSVQVQVVSADICDATAGTCEITNVTANEPINHLGDGTTEPADWEKKGPLTVDLRAERAGTLTDRIYTIYLSCKDLAGNASTTTTSVMVAHDEKN